MSDVNTQGAYGYGIDIIWIIIVIFVILWLLGGFFGPPKRY